MFTVPVQRLLTKASYGDQASSLKAVGLQGSDAYNIQAEAQRVVRFQPDFSSASPGFPRGDRCPHRYLQRQSSEAKETTNIVHRKICLRS